MPGHLQERFGCVVTNRFDQLFDDESDPLELRKESQKDHKNPLPPSMGVADKKEEMQPLVALKKEGISGLKHEDKHGGSRSHNWGTVKDELTDLDQSNVTEETPEGEEHPVTDTENKENEVEKVKEEGPKEMTLNEWKDIQNKDRAKVEFNIQKPNEGADEQWKRDLFCINQKVKRLMLKTPLWTIISGSQQMI
ncbi:plasminogen activator inhibitor 1 RNA-binding protein isoform X3 [Sigmodon hispidus]